MLDLNAIRGGQEMQPGAPVPAQDTPAVAQPGPALLRPPLVQSRQPGIAPGNTPIGLPNSVSDPRADSLPPDAAGSPPAMQTAAPQAPRKGQFTLNFDDADVYGIIQTVFGEILKANYVVDPRVKGRVTFRAIAPVPIDNVLPLMEVILRLNGIGIVEEGGLYRIVPISDISKEPSPVNYGRDPEKIQVTGKALLQVVPILHVQSSETIKMLTPFVSNNAVLIDVPKGNQIIVVDTDANVKRLLKLVEIFDNEKLTQRKPQLFVYHVQNGKAKEIASLLQQIFMGGRESETGRTLASGRTGRTGAAPPATMPMPMQAPESPATAAPPKVTAIPAGDGAVVSETVRIIADEITNSIAVLATPEDYITISAAIGKIDTVPRQVIIESMIASVNLTDNLSLGLAGVLKGSISGFGTNVGVNTNLLTAGALSQAGFSFVVTDAAGLVRGLLSALASESQAKVLASPHILVSDNRDARIQVGQQVPLMTSETYGVAGVAPQRNYSYKDIGIILKVKPQINEGGLVSLELAQEISTFEKITVGGTEQLLINKTDAMTSLVVQDGQTIVIGGLIREDVTKSSSGVPFLSKIPLIGWLFGGSVDDTKRQEIIILLTPRVIKNQKDAQNLSGEFIDKMTGSSKGGISPEALAPGKTPPGQPVGDPSPNRSTADGPGK